MRGPRAASSRRAAALALLVAHAALARATPARDSLARHPHSIAAVAPAPGERQGATASAPTREAPLRSTERDAPAAARAQGIPASTSTDPRDSARSDEAARRALERGLAWLALAQRRGTDGSFSAEGARSTSAGTGPAADVGGFAPVAVTALAALAWMAGGSAPDRGTHGRECAAAIEWLVARADLDPRSERAGYVSRTGDALSRMHGHGFAALALAQACVASPRTPRGARVRAALVLAVHLIERSQGVEGGWDYEPRKGLAHENSITITAVQALRAAKEAGVEVDRSVISRAVDYVGRTQKSDGSFRYALGDPLSTVALTAAAIGTFQMTGTYEGPKIAEGYDYIARRLALRDSPQGVEGDTVICPYYERLYVAQAMWQHLEPTTWSTWWRSERPRVLGAQGADGSWKDARFGDVYATAMNCLVLAVPEGLLPIFQR